MERMSAILLPVTSLPSRGGIGTLGREASHFLSFLKRSGVEVWQMLPLGPTGYGDSPYSPLSSFAGNPYLIDPVLLHEDGLLKDEDFFPVAACKYGDVDYGWVYETRFIMLEAAWRRGREMLAEEFSVYRRTCSQDIRNYALYSAFKERNGMTAWYTWKGPERSIRTADQAIDDGIRERAEFYEFCQFLFDRQFTAFRKQAQDMGIQLMGDIPFYAAADSADVWADPECFRLFEDGAPREVAGVPPDYFSEDGQLWGNPLYNWDFLKKQDYEWIRRRIAATADKFDIIRLDHFRGYDTYWCVQAGEETAKIGKWEQGPGREFVDMLSASFPHTVFIAEDLGDLSESVVELLKYSGYPGMKVLEFGFYEDSVSGYLPHNHSKNCIVYTGTHDNDTAGGWLAEVSEKDRVETAPERSRSTEKTP